MEGSNLMNIQRDIQIYWGEQLVKVKQNVLEKYELPRETSQFLQTVGLPLDKNMADYPALRITFSPHDFTSIAYYGENYISIGDVNFYSDKGYICLKEKNGECVLLDLRPNASSHVKFVNSDISRFLFFIKTTLQARPTLQQLVIKKDELIQGKRRKTLEGEGEYKQVLQTYQVLLESIKKEFSLIDPKALEPCGIYFSYWGLYLAEFY
jgi:hypothetical protein